ncbi:hypothetical protein BUC_7238 [Burkholderia pseudomallei 576]|nr:hypothetical protein BUC_7238 [Burkholderia pseudomallei 576]
MKRSRNAGASLLRLRHTRRHRNSLSSRAFMPRVDDRYAVLRRARQASPACSENELNRSRRPPDAGHPFLA